MYEWSHSQLRLETNIVQELTVRNKIIPLAFLVFLLAIAEPVEANAPSNLANRHTHDVKSSFTQPLTDANSNVIDMPIVKQGASTGSSLDQQVQNWVQSHRTIGCDKVAHIGRQFGEPKYVLPTLGVVYLYGKNEHNLRLKNTALVGARSVLVANGITQALKWTFHRHRPNSGSPRDTWDGPSLSPKHVSFPSGHSATAFAWATVVASEYHDKPGVSSLAYSAAALTAFSRVNDNEHWLTDVLVGSAIGYYTAKTIIHRQRPVDSESPGTAVMQTIPLLAVSMPF